MSDVAQHHFDLGQVGHDAGRVVLHFERRVALPAVQVREALLASGRAAPVDGRERWDVEDERPASRLSFTAWIDAEDADRAAGAGAAYHSFFNEVVRLIQQHPEQASSDDADTSVLTAAYQSAFAAALADTD